MKNQISKLLVLALSVAMLLTVSCRDEWDDHYKPEIKGKSSSSIIEYIQSRSDMSIFLKMLEMTGYDTLLAKSQTFTVWVPVNSSLSAIDLNDALAVRRLVENHVTYFSVPTAFIKNKPLTMVDKKLLWFKKEVPNFTLGSQTISETDIALSNGIVHVLNNYVPYKLNVWEYLTETAGLDSVRNYIQSLTQNVYDPSASFNSDGVFVDSVFYEFNPVLKYLCDMKNEDSTYTAVFPDNAAWNEMYNRVKPFYKILPTHGGDSLQKVYTKSTIVANLFFRGKNVYPVSEAKTYLSTWGDTISNINEVLGGNAITELSNGIAYQSSSLKYKNVDVFHKPIRVEAETIVGIDTLKSNYALSRTSSLGSNMVVSNNYYLTALPTTTSSLSKLFVRFPIPNTLSAKYNIYCVFVPTSIVDETDLRPYKANFYITYVNSSGKTVKDSKLTVANSLTNPNKITKMLIAQNFEFPYSNLLRSDNSEKISVVLKVENAATPTEERNRLYNRTIRIDCIILEPVQ